MQKNTFQLKSGLAQMLKGGVIMDVMTVEQAKIAEKCGAVAVMALERIPSKIRQDGGVARMSDPKLIKEIKAAVSIPVMAKVRIGHFVEAQILESLKIDFIDESEVLTPADEENHIEKKRFNLPFVCGCRNLGEALRRINEGAAMIRTKGEAGTGNIVEAVRHHRRIKNEISALKPNNFKAKAKEYRVPLDLIKQVYKLKKLPVVNFAAGGIANPADASLMMQMGCEGVFVGSGIFEAQNPEKMGRAIVEAVMNYDKPEIVAKVSEGLGLAMPSLEIDKLQTRYSDR
ncbi:MAG: pyridoxal 5'-phosphate synthase lyase subunit PdxS [Candidatus Magasanikbacteria bacterium CG10_big_fil_rev_8_21_14_0_10_40_10]|uniref:Pyridoxal 5'-phosphate synthase subunit PdxS n=1 Tax=Candidatus Magasanikbacteria bacterium CG10_big_fil_rev_8_21_14_0_10_40_10 TaxID=1974648 RepID=A0A2M6W3R0_9BACT|nr:MAG: pyridoxal 5'-phosphate synthase lyase subunit PdxS [Candidatus Magasanikbacteria bacterium CG10_big_fil_rev_8_21_14_0_10_40_10]